VLSDQERKVLDELERQFMAEDPEFARSFPAREQCPPRAHHRPATKVAIVVALLLCALMLVAGSLSGALAFVGATGLIWVMWRYWGAISGRAT
jgi:hypothetical protein